MLAAALHDAEREGLIARNPATLVRPPRRRLPQLEVLGIDDALAVIKLAHDALAAAREGGVYNPYPMRWAVALLTGARRGEVLGLELDRIVLSGQQPHIDLSWQLQRLPRDMTPPADFEHRPVVGGLWLTRPKTSAGWRIVPLVDPLRGALEAHVAHVDQNPWGLAFAPGGRPIDPHADTKRWKKVLEELGIERHVRVHDIRHTTVDLLYEAGVPEHIIMEIVGHSIRTVTRGYKSRGNAALLASGMQKLSDLLGIEVPASLRASIQSGRLIS